MKILDKNLKNNYKKYGISIVRNFFKKSEIIKIKKYTDYIKFLKIKPNQVMKYYEKSVNKLKKKDVLIRAEYFYHYHNGLNKLLNSKKINNFLKFLTNSDCRIFKEKINYKPAGARSDKLHQDSQAGWNKFAKEFISVLISVQKSTKLNGCLEFDFSGNNCYKLISQEMKPLKIKQLYKPNFIPTELNVGDVVFFNSYIPHRSGPNLSNRDRCQIYVTYNKKNLGNLRDKYFSEKRKQYPPNNERDAINEYKYKV